MANLELFQSLNDRYYALKQIGSGTFANVYLAYDFESPQERCPFVAVKVLTMAYSAYAAAQERKAYESLDSATYQPTRDRVIKLLDFFEFDDVNTGGKHASFVFELFQCDLAEFLRGCRLKLPLVKSVTKQILEGLTFMHNECQLIHGDLKPENILIIPDKKTLAYKCRRAYEKARSILKAHPSLKKSLPSSLFDNIEADLTKLEKEAESEVFNPSDPKIKVIISDLGSSVRCDRFRKQPVQTRLFRAPEVILGMTYGFRVDIWSMGTIIYQMLSGRYLVNIWDNSIQSEVDIDLVHLKIIQERIGPIAKALFSSEKGKEIFCPKLTERLPTSRRFLELRLNSMEYTQECAVEIGKFLRALLQVDPVYRINARQALDHSFLTGQAASPFEIHFNELQEILDEDELISRFL